MDRMLRWTRRQHRLGWRIWPSQKLALLLLSWLLGLSYWLVPDHISSIATLAAEWSRRRNLSECMITMTCHLQFPLTQLSAVFADMSRNYVGAFPWHVTPSVIGFDAIWTAGLIGYLLYLARSGQFRHRFIMNVGSVCLGYFVDIEKTRHRRSSML
jgi:hypothetical protein